MRDLRHVVEQRRHLLDRRPRLGLDLEAELGREAHGADDAHRVFAVARDRVADHAQQLLLRVLDAAVVVDHDLAHRVVVHRVDGEVAPRGVLDLRAPDVVAQHAALGVDGVVHAGELALREVFSLPLTCSASAVSSSARKVETSITSRPGPRGRGRTRRGRCESAGR